MLRKEQDAYGKPMYDYFIDKSGIEVLEREDGFIDVSSPRTYFTEYKEWQPHVRAAMKYVRGRVLDIGCGAGRHSIYLQGKGFDVLGIDNSPSAVKTARLRGLRMAKVLPINQLGSKLGIFDTILMLGNNFGLFGSQRGAKQLLARFHRMTSEDARIIAESMDIYKGAMPEHRSYHQLNKRRGRMPGQARIRARYRSLIGPWFDYLLVSKTEMKRVLKGSGWRVAKLMDSGGASYIAIIEKERSQ